MKIEQPPPPEGRALPHDMTSHLQHFGFFPGSVDAADSMEEQAGTCNVTKVLGVSWNHNSNEWTDPAPGFARAAAAGQRVLMNLPEGADRPRFAEWAAIVRPYADQILAFFVMDEPDCACGGDATRLAELLDGIEAYIREIRTAFPGARTMMTLGCFDARLPGLGFRLPAGLTDIAIEAYHGRTQWQGWLERLTPYLTPTHRLWLMPFVYTTAPTADYLPQTDAEQIIEAQVIYEYAKTDPRIVGILPFAWYDGARDRPAVRRALSTIGREIVNQAIGPPVDMTPRLAAIVPGEVTVGRPFTLALLGEYFAPRAIAQYAIGGTFVDYPASYRNPTTLTVSAPPIPAGHYQVRVKNPDGAVTDAQTVHVVECR